ncbi:hypothetical protein C0992_011143 [Termitomyces sp. T32_za158]|nr:hypothetical protein C0992_011143 [Termitomyces sp. T32_za158]
MTEFRIPSIDEATSYYSGISPDPPMLLYRTGKIPWTMPTGPEAYRELSEMRGVFGHRINDVWKTLGHEGELLDQQKVLWSSIDVVRFCKSKNTSVLGPVVLWIGVLPDTLTCKEAFNSANGLLELLQRHDITDVDVEYREFVYRRSVGPPLLKWLYHELYPTADYVGPLTAVLGLPIASSTMPHLQGNLGFYLADGGQSEDLLAVTARHVLFPPNEASADYTYTNNDMPRKDVILLGLKGYRDLVKSIKYKMDELGRFVDTCKEEIQQLAERVAGDDEKNVREAETSLKKVREESDWAKKSIGELRDLFNKIRMGWRETSNRVIGHVIHSPAITFGADPYGFTKDYAVIKIDKDRFRKSFMGNVLHIGTKISPSDFIHKMHPKTHNQARVEYYGDRLIPLQNIISEDMMRSPDTVDHNGEPCLFVVKNGPATDFTIGRATGIFSHVREYFPNQTFHTSMEWSILPYGKAGGLFSADGDSGSVIVDGCGRFGGLLTGGAGKTISSDISYATPIWWLLAVIQENGFPDAHLYPTKLCDPDRIGIREASER